MSPKDFDTEVLMRELLRRASVEQLVRMLTDIKENERDRVRD